jgi:hypothetical protein
MISDSIAPQLEAKNGERRTQTIANNIAAATCDQVLKALTPQ